MATPLYVFVISADNMYELNSICQLDIHWRVTATDGHLHITAGDCCCCYPGLSHCRSFLALHTTQRGVMDSRISIRGHAANAYLDLSSSSHAAWRIGQKAKQGKSMVLDIAPLRCAVALYNLGGGS